MARTHYLQGFHSEQALPVTSCYWLLLADFSEIKVLYPFPYFTWYAISQNRVKCFCKIKIHSIHIISHVQCFCPFVQDCQQLSDTRATFDETMLVFSTIWCMIRSLMIDSRVLQMTDVRLTGMYFLAWCLLPFLKMGDISPIFQPTGIFPRSRDWLKIWYSGSVIIYCIFFSTLGAAPSGPGNLFGLILDSFLLHFLV